jgi:hypothetical protein
MTVNMAGTSIAKELTRLCEAKDLKPEWQLRAACQNHSHRTKS